MESSNIYKEEGDQDSLKESNAYPGIKDILFNFRGRLDRLSWLFFGFLVVDIYFLLQMSLSYAGESVIFDLLISVFALLSVYIVWVLHIKRAHDIGKSGWFSLLLLIPVVNVVVFLMFLLKKGDGSENIYGKVSDIKTSVFKVLLVVLLYFVLLGVFLSPFIRLAVGFFGGGFEVGKNYVEVQGTDIEVGDPVVVGEDLFRAESVSEIETLSDSFEEASYGEGWNRYESRDRDLFEIQYPNLMSFDRTRSYDSAGKFIKAHSFVYGNGDTGMNISIRYNEDSRILYESFKNQDVYTIVEDETVNINGYNGYYLLRESDTDIIHTYVMQVGVDVYQFIINGYIPGIDREVADSIIRSLVFVN